MAGTQEDVYWCVPATAVAVAQAGLCYVSSGGPSCVCRASNLGWLYFPSWLPLLSLSALDGVKEGPRRQALWKIAVRAVLAIDLSIVGVRN